MPLYYARNGYSFGADLRSLTIEPGPEPITLGAGELEQLGLAIRNDYRVPSADEHQGGTLIAGILAVLSDALRRFEGPANERARRDVRRAMVLVGALDEKTAREILDREAE
jgi:hypothetical protein